MPSATRFTAAGLLGVVLGLLALEVVSGTPMRHLVQVAPAIVALVLVIRQTPEAYYAALPIFLFWLLIMTAIWLFLLGLARIITGQYSLAELVLTFVVGSSCVVGLSQVFRAGPVASRLTRTIWAIVFAALQIAAMWLSLRPGVATT
jgi:hypothetical protein